MNNFCLLLFSLSIKGNILNERSEMLVVTFLLIKKKRKVACAVIS